jgi:hypothetical protein
MGGDEPGMTDSGHTLLLTSPFLRGFPLTTSSFAKLRWRIWKVRERVREIMSSFLVPQSSTVSESLGQCLVTLEKGDTPAQEAGQSRPVVVMSNGGTVEELAVVAPSAHYFIHNTYRFAIAWAIWSLYQGRRVATCYCFRGERFRICALRVRASSLQSVNGIRCVWWPRCQPVLIMPGSSRARATLLLYGKYYCALCGVRST